MAINILIDVLGEVEGGKAAADAVRHVLFTDWHQRMHLLKLVPLFKSLCQCQCATQCQCDNRRQCQCQCLDTVARALLVKVYQDQDIIIEEGDEGSSLFLIFDGSVECIRKGKSTMMLYKEDHFGGQALLPAEAQAATIRAHGCVKCLMIDNRTFHDLIGHDRAGSAAPHPCAQELHKSRKQAGRLVSLASIK